MDINTYMLKCLINGYKYIHVEMFNGYKYIHVEMFKVAFR